MVGKKQQEAPKKQQEAPKGRASIYKGTDKSTSVTKAKKAGNEVTYNVRVKPKGPQGVMSAPYKIEKRTVKTSRGR